MTDLTQYNNGNAYDANETETEGSGLEPGRYTMHFAGDEIIAGKNNWVALKMYFEIDGTTIVMNTTFTLGSDNPKAMEIGDISLKLLLKAMGVTSMKNTEVLVGKSVSGQLIRDPDNERYMKIDQNYGKNWQPVEGTKAEAPKPAAEPAKVEAKDDSEFDDKIPF